MRLHSAVRLDRCHGTSIIRLYAVKWFQRVRIMGRDSQLILNFEGERSGEERGGEGEGEATKLGFT
jgi:hypothetical protein